MKKAILFAAILLVAVACNQTSQTGSVPQQAGPAKNVDPNVKTYSSDKLGIKFNYYGFAAGGPANKVNVKEDGRFILLSDAYQPDFQEFIEVFTKDPNRSLSNAVSSELSLNRYRNCKTHSVPEDSLVDLQFRGSHDDTDCPNVIYQGQKLDNYSHGSFIEDAISHQHYYFYRVT